MKVNELFSAHVENFLRIIQDKIAEGRLIEAQDMIDFFIAFDLDLDYIVD
jgi:hypothetical protein